MLKIGGFDGGLGGMAMVQELRAELLRARAKGKKIVAYVEGSAVGEEYYLAAVADKIIAPPGSAVGGFGKSLAIYRLKGLYKKIGIEY
jgi:protease-4